MHIVQSGYPSGFTAFQQQLPIQHARFPEQAQAARDWDVPADRRQPPFRGAPSYTQGNGLYNRPPGHTRERLSQRRTQPHEPPPATDLPLPPDFWMQQRRNPQASLPPGVVRQRVGAEELAHQELIQNLAGKSSIMISNIPCRITQERFASVVADLGFDGTYDFLYVPTGGRTGEARSVNLGYGFINFLTPEITLAFTHLFNGYKFEGSRGENRCLIRPAQSQGMLSNVRRLCRTALRHEARGRHISPVIRINGGPRQRLSDVIRAFEDSECL